MHLLPNLPLHPERGLRLGELAALLPFLFRDGVVSFPLPLIAEPLVEHQRQDVILVVLPRRLAAKNVRRAPQVRFELLEGKFHFDLAPYIETSHRNIQSSQLTRKARILMASGLEPGTQLEVILGAKGRREGPTTGFLASGTHTNLSRLLHLCQRR